MSLSDCRRNLSPFLDILGLIKKSMDILLLLCVSATIYSGFVLVTQIPAVWGEGLLVKAAINIFLFQFYVYLFIAIIKIILEFFEDRRRAFCLCLLLLIAYIHNCFSEHSLMNYLDIMVMAIAANRIKFSRIAKLFLIEEGVMILLTIMLAVFGILPNDVLTIEENRTIITLGFGSHNVLMIIELFNCLLMFFLLREKKSFYIATLVALVIGCSAYVATRSRTSFYVMLLFLAGILLISFINKKRIEGKKVVVYEKISRIAIFIPLLCLLVSIVGVLLWNYNIQHVDISFDIRQGNGSTMTARFRDGSINFAANGFVLPWENLPTQRIRETEGFNFNWLFGGGKSTLFLDNVYLGSFITAGIIGFGLVMLYMMYLLYRAHKTRDIVMSWVFVCICVFAIMEAIDQFVYNPFILIIFSAWELETNKVIGEGIE